MTNNAFTYHDGVPYPMWLVGGSPFGGQPDRSAEMKAWRFLIEHLTAQQIADLVEYSAFDVTSESGAVYRLLLGSGVFRTRILGTGYPGGHYHPVFNGRGCVGHICINLYKPYGRQGWPLGDTMLALKLWVERNEDQLLLVGN